MKISLYDIYENYQDYKEEIRNEVDIFGEIEVELNKIVNLDYFTGKAADSVKEYTRDVLLEINKVLCNIIRSTFNTMHNGMEGYRKDVDSYKSSVIITEHLDDIITGIKDIYYDYTDIVNGINSEIKSVSDIAPIDKNYETISNELNDGIEETIRKINNTKTKLIDYNDNHKTDFNQIDEAVDKIIAYIDLANNSLNNKLTVPKNSKKLFSDIDKCLSKYSKDVKEPIKDLEELLKKLGNLCTNYNFMKILGQFELFIGDRNALLSKGLKLITEYKDGKEFARIISSTGEDADVVRGILKSMDTDIPYLSKSKINKLVKGIPTNKLSSNLAESFSKVSGFKSLSEKISNIPVTKIGKAAKTIDGIGYAITIGSNIYDNIYDKDNGKVDINATAVADTITDSAVDIGMDVGIQYAGAAIGTAICPGVGTIAGYAVGAGVSAATTIKFIGEPPKSVTDFAKDGVSTVTHKIGDCLSKTFW